MYICDAKTHFIKRIAVWSAAVILFVLIGFATLACSESNDRHAKLSAPSNLRVENDVLQWNAVSGADGYVVEIDGTEYDVDTDSMDIFMLTDKIKTYEIRVMAVNNRTYKVSDWSSFKYTVELSPYLSFVSTNNGKAYSVGVAVNDKNSIGGKVIIPRTYGSMPVVAIAGSGFSSCKNIVSVVIPDTVTEIRQNAFNACTALERVIIRSGLRDIGTSVFFGCESLTSVNLPESVENIELKAFYDCAKLENIVLPSKLKSVGDRAFFNCDSLSNIHIPAATENLNRGNFGACTELTVDENNRVYRSENNCIMRKIDNVLVLGCSNSTIPSNVQKIGEYAFNNCDITDMTIPYGIELGYYAFFNTSAKHVVLPDSISVIPEGLFAYSELTSVVIPDSVKTIDCAAFLSCKSLSKVDFGDGLKKLGVTQDGKRGAFKDCTALKALELPKTLSELNGAVFSGCTALSELSVADENPLFCSKNNCIIERESKTLVMGCKSSVIPDEVVCIGEYAFYGCSISVVDFPSGLQKISKAAFCNCIDLHTFNIPKSVTYIGDLAFGWDDGYIPYSRGPVTLHPQVTSVAEIWGEAFSGFTVYTQVSKQKVYENDPENNFHSGLNLAPCFKYSSNVAYDCDIRCDNDIPYVYSISTRGASLMGGYSDKEYNTRGFAHDLPVREGHTFCGWAVVENGDVVYPPELFSGPILGDLSQFYNNVDKPYRVALTTEIVLKARAADQGTLYAVWQKV